MNGYGATKESADMPEPVEPVTDPMHLLELSCALTSENAGVGVAGNTTKRSAKYPQSALHIFDGAFPDHARANVQTDEALNAYHVDVAYSCV